MQNVKSMRSLRLPNNPSALKVSRTENKRTLIRNSSRMAVKILSLLKPLNIRKFIIIPPYEVKTAVCTAAVLNLSSCKHWLKYYIIAL
jgi:hypothetical protein